jgi:hypothetical protein
LGCWSVIAENNEDFVKSILGGHPGPPVREMFGFGIFDRRAMLPEGKTTYQAVGA